MTTVILFGSLILLLLLTVPIGIALGLATLISIMVSGVLPLGFLAKELVTSIDSFPLMAVFFFILAGEIMGKGGITERLFNVANSLVGNKTGGFGIATIITCMFFAAISGSGPATVAAIGGVMIPSMVRQGYDIKFATAIVVTAGSLGVIIPPSIPMVIYGAVGNVSIGNLFIAGILPGIFIGVMLMFWTYYYAKKKGYTGADEKTSLSNILKATWEAKWALLLPVIILGGIYGGVFTPTEAAAVAVVFGLVVGLFLYRELKIKDLPKVFTESALISATILIIVGIATAFGRLLTIERIPDQIAQSMLSISDNPIIIMLLINVLLLIIGCFMDTLAAIIIVTPIMLPIAMGIGYDPVHFGIIMIVNLAIGFITPPLGVNLFVGSGVSGLPVLTIARATIPFFFVMIFTLVILIFIPQISLFLLSFMQ